MTAIRKLQSIREALTQRILVLDGAMGTSLEQADLTAADYGGESRIGCNEALNIFNPDAVKNVHKDFLHAGADIIETNTFNGSRLLLDEYNLSNRIDEINRRGVEIAREAIKEYGGTAQRYVCATIGPTNRSLSLTGGITFDALYECFKEQILILLAAAPDYILLETQQDTLNLKAALCAVQDAIKETGQEIPFAVSVTIELNGTMLGGQNIEALYYTIEHNDLLYLGLNCATGPDKMQDHLTSLAQVSRFPLAVVPNAGMPDENGVYSSTPDDFHAIIERYIIAGKVNVLGGCCGTQPDHIRVLRQLADAYSPRTVDREHRISALAGFEALTIENLPRPLPVGERTNVIGSRKFRDLLADERYDLAAEIGKEQVAKGAVIIDVCTANPDRDELKDFLGVVIPLQRKIRTPIMIDSIDRTVIETALKNVIGKPVINSVNFEKGSDYFRSVAMLAKKHGALLVVGLIDEQGMGITTDRKIEIAQRAISVLTGELGLHEQDVIFDALTFPVGTGKEEYQDSALATINALKEIKAHWPAALTILGVSNVSFGLPTQGREILNTVYMQECVAAGLDFAIVNTARLRRFTQLQDDEIRKAHDIIYHNSPDTIKRFSDAFREKTSRSALSDIHNLPPDKQLHQMVLNGQRLELETVLDALLQQQSALDIINGPLLEGMKAVGVLFGDNKLIIAEVLESAETMRAAIAYLQPFIAEDETQKKAKLLLATVKGDVHDIGKNLVMMIFSNNGFDVIDLGTKVPPSEIVDASKKYKPNLIGLSGLLVRSAHQMIETAEALRDAGITVPVIVGGAALTDRFTREKISAVYDGPVVYASEAMKGLSLAQELISGNNPEERLRNTKNNLNRTAHAELLKTQSGIQDPPHRSDAGAQSHAVLPAINTPHHSDAGAQSSAVLPAINIPQPSDFHRHVEKELPLDAIFHLINIKMLYGKHIGLRNPVRRLNDIHDADAQKYKNIVEEIQRSAVINHIIQPKAVWQHLSASSENDSIVVFSDNKVEQRFAFLRKQTVPYTCAADWVAPKTASVKDSIGMLVVTAGNEVWETINQWRAEGELLRSHILSALALQTAEATAEYIHRKIIIAWGLADEELLQQDLSALRTVRGIRLSFGYPSCPELSYQRALFDILHPEDINIRLTDEYMMAPEASVSAVVFHHPDAQYYIP